MTRFTISAFSCVISIFLLGSERCYSQSAVPSKSAQPQNELVMKQLVNEVRGLRMALTRITTNAFRAQVMIERLRLQQEQVNRLTLDLVKARTEIGDLKSTRLHLEAKAVAMEKDKEAGLVAESDLNTLKAAIEALNLREPGLAERESRLLAELNVDRGTLEMLSRRLDEVEMELLPDKGEKDRPREQ
jgi:hypothetical protein